MRKIQKKRSKFVFRDKSFDTFKTMKTFAYFNIRVGDKDTGFEMYQDEIIKEYVFKRQERRLLCEKIYDRNEKLKKEAEKKQLKLFADG